MGEGGGPGEEGGVRMCLHFQLFFSHLIRPCWLLFTFGKKYTFLCLTQSCWKLMELFFFLIKVLEDSSKNINRLKMFTECRKPSLLRNSIFHKDKNIASM